MKTKGQQPLVAKPELLALWIFRGGVAEWLNATGCKPADDAQNIVQGFKSLPRRQNCNYTPAEALTSTEAIIRTAEAARTFNSIIGFSLCDLKEISQMTLRNCRIEAKRFGKHRNGLQRLRCNQCGKRRHIARDQLRPNCTLQ